MKKVVSLILFLAAALTLHAEVVWTGTHNTSETQDWNALQLPIANYAVLANAQAGDIIAITVSEIAETVVDKRIDLQTMAWQGLGDCTIYGVQPGVYSFVLTAATAAEVSTNGVIVTGQKYTLTKVELLYQKTLWLGSVDDYTGWTQSNVIPCKLFADLSENSIIGIQISNINDGADWHQYALRADWRTNIVVGSVSAAKTYPHTLSAAEADSLRNKNMIITAQYLNVTALYAYVDARPAADTKVYFVNNQGWNNVNCYAWDGGNNNNWPGEAMTNTERTINGDVIWEISGLNSYVNCIFNNGSGQTGNLDLYPGMMYYDGIGWVAFATDNMMLVGDMNGWVGEWMTDAADFKSCSITKTLTPGIYEFKLIRDIAWLGNNGTMTRANCTGWTFGLENNCQIKVDIPGDYVFTFNYAAKALSVTYPTTFTRTVAQERANKYQSLCVPFDANITNATAYAVTEVNTTTGIVTIAEAANLEAGHSYLIQPEAAGDIVISMKDGGAVVGAPIESETYMYGILGNNYYPDASAGAYLLQDNQFCLIAGEAVGTVPSTYAYLKATIYVPNDAPALRIVVAENGATNLENVDANDEVEKFFRNGQLFIKKNGVIYSATGAVVK